MFLLLCIMFYERIFFILLLLGLLCERPPYYFIARQKIDQTFSFISSMFFPIRRGLHIYTFATLHIFIQSKVLRLVMLPRVLDLYISINLHLEKILLSCIFEGL